MNNIPIWLKVIATTLVVLGLIFLYLWQGWQVIYLQRRVSDLEDELIPLEERKKELQLEVARYYSYERIERIAKERLGMIEPDLSEEE
jgi:cell division protein FtsL